MIAKQWVGFVMIAALCTASACAQGMNEDDSSSREVASTGGFVPLGTGYRAESPGHRVDINEGVIQMAPRALLPSSSAAAAKRGSLEARAPQASVVTQSLIVALQTVAAQRGSTALDITVLDSGLSAPDVVETVRADFIELLRNTATGAEQSWQFASAPGTSGELTVEIAAADVSYVGSIEAGLVFERANVLRMSYGHGTWIDADGDRWSIPARLLNGRIALTVPSAVVASSSYPAVLDPQIVVTPIGNVVGPHFGPQSIAPQIIVTPIGGPPPAAPNSAPTTPQ